MKPILNIRPIRSETQHLEYLRRLEALFDRELEVALSGDEQDEMKLLELVVADYEQVSESIPAPSPQAVVEFFMAQRGLQQKDLQPYFGSAPRVSEFLKGKRNLTVRQIAALAQAFQIPADLLLPRRNPALAPTP